MSCEIRIISELGKAIIEKLYETGKSQSWLAEECKVTKCHISMVIRGKCRASNILLWGISKALDLDFDALVALNRKKSA
jgi:transcriptional regulator with XRE-family HTH domain